MAITNKHITPYDFIKNDECHVFLHTTSESNAKMILETGFMFSNINILKTIDEVQCPPTHFEFIVEYLITERKEYGDAIAVIHVGYNLMKKYSGLWEECLSDNIPDFDQEEFSDVECVRKLHVQFIKGYFVKATGEFFANEQYNPTEDRPEFDARLKEILNRNIE